MQYAILIYETAEAFAGRATRDDRDPLLAAWRSYHRSLVEAGVYVAGEPLRAPDTGTTVRIKNGKREIQDGPYATTKEQLAGFQILELPSLDAAIEWASRCPAAGYGAVEVRPLAPDVHQQIVGE
jgi:hypothetical protein